MEQLTKAKTAHYGQQYCLSINILHLFIFIVTTFVTLDLIYIT